MKDGGPAFPELLFHESGIQGWHGMTLRDYFAAAALPSVYRLADDVEPVEYIAEHAYRMADAMLKAREQ